MKTVYRTDFNVKLAEHFDDGRLKSSGEVVEGNGTLYRSRAEAEAKQPNSIAEYEISDEDFTEYFANFPPQE